MESKQHKKESNRQKLMERFSPSRPIKPNAYTDFLESIRQQYPQVPEQHQMTWYLNDEKLPQLEERNEMILKHAEALEAAAQLCRHLAQSQQHVTTPAEIEEQKTTLIRAAHHAEELLIDIAGRYPMPELTIYKLARKCSDTSAYTPKLLKNSDEHIVIWMPHLPTKKARTTDHILFQELSDLLFEEKFPQFKKWHCDFVHVFDPDEPFGILDADNYLYKPIIDALTFAIQSKDCMEYFSYSFYNLENKTVHPGTYIVVSNRTQKVEFFDFFASLISTPI